MKLFYKDIAALIWSKHSIPWCDTAPLWTWNEFTEVSSNLEKKNTFLWKLISNWLWNFHWACRQLRAERGGYFSYRTFNTSDWLTKTDTQKPHSRSKCLVCTKNSEKPYASFLNWGDTLQMNTDSIIQQSKTGMGEPSLIFE